MSQEQKVNEYAQNLIPREGNPSQNEAWALIEVSRRMASVIQHGDLTKKIDKDKLRDAMRLNLRLWTVIQAEQSFGDELLPDPIRQNILTLCKFVDRHTIASIPNPTAENIIALIDINRNIASGLMGSPDEQNTVDQNVPSTKRQSQAFSSKDKKATQSESMEVVV